VCIRSSYAEPSILGKDTRKARWDENAIELEEINRVFCLELGGKPLINAGISAIKEK
jgi:glutamate mutase epsilon subunit